MFRALTISWKIISLNWFKPVLVHFFVAKRLVDWSLTSPVLVFVFQNDQLTSLGSRFTFLEAKNWTGLDFQTLPTSLLPPTSYLSFHLSLLSCLLTLKLPLWLYTPPAIQPNGWCCLPWQWCVALFIKCWGRWVFILCCAGCTEWLATDIYIMQTANNAT